MAEEKTMEERIREALAFHQEQVTKFSTALVYIEQNKEGAEALMALMSEYNGYRMGIGRI